MKWNVKKYICFAVCLNKYLHEVEYSKGIMLVWIEIVETKNVHLIDKAIITKLIGWVYVISSSHR